MKHFPIKLKIELSVDFMDYITIEVMDVSPISDTFNSPIRIYREIIKQYLYDFFSKYKTVNETEIKNFLVKIFQWFNIKCTVDDFEIKYNKSKDTFDRAFKKCLYYYNPELETEETEDFKELNVEVK